MKIKILKKVAKELNNCDCTWALGSSLLLNHYGIVKNPNDIDLLIKAEDSHKVKEALKNMGTPLNLLHKAPFKTKEFFGFNINGVDVEIMGDFSIDLGNNNTYNFILDNKSITDKINLDGIIINLTSLEDWLVAYLVMKDPKNRVPLILSYFEDKGIKHWDLLERNLNQPLSNDIKSIIKNILRFEPK